MIDVGIEQLIKELWSGFDPNPDTKDIESRRLIAHYISCPENANAELKATIGMAKIAKKRALEYLKSAGLTPELNSSKEPKFEYAWNKYFKCYVIKLRVVGSDHPIEINILNNTSNNNFNPDDIRRMHDAKLVAALACYKGDKNFEFSLQSISATYKQELDQLCNIDYLSLTLDQLLAKIANLEQRYITSLASAMVRAEHKSNTYVPHKHEIKAQIENIKKMEITISSNTPRPIIINAHPQYTEDPNKPQYVLSIHKPITDISSDSRSFSEQQLSNYWETNIETVHLSLYRNKVDGSIEYRQNHEFKDIDKNSHISFFRSSSVAQLGDEIHDPEIKRRITATKIMLEKQKELLESKLKDPTTNKSTIKTQLANTSNALEELDNEVLDIKKSQELAGLKTTILEDAADQVFAKLLNSEQLDTDEPLVIKRGFITLLSPHMDQDTGKQFINPLTKGLEGALVHGNELAQLQSMQATFETIKNIPLNDFRLEDDQIRTIISRLKKHKRLTPAQEQELINKLQQIKIKQKNSYLNIPVNKFGSIEMEKFDWGNFNYAYNKAGMLGFIDNIKDYLQNNQEFNINPKIKNQAALLIDFITHPKIPNTKDDWINIKKSYLAAVTNKIQDPTLSTILDLYVKIQNHLQEKNSSEKIKKAAASVIAGRSIFSNEENKSDNSRIANGYIVAAACIFKLNTILGYKNHVTCKSGKDRTGLLAAIVEALLDPNSEHLVIKNICNAIRFSSIKAMNELNVPGSRSLQVDNDVLDGLKDLFGMDLEGMPEEIKDLIREQMLRDIGKLSRNVYKCDAAIDAWLKNPDVIAVHKQQPQSQPQPQQKIATIVPATQLPPKLPPRKAPEITRSYAASTSSDQPTSHVQELKKAIELKMQREKDAKAQQVLGETTPIKKPGGKKPPTLPKY